MSNAVGMFLRQIVLQKVIPFEMKLPRTAPLTYGSLTKEQFDKEIEKGMSDVKAINCRIHGHRLLTWAITKKYRHEMIMRRSRWKKLSKKSSREKMEIGCSGICRILSGLSLIISMTVWERRKTFNTVTEHKTTGNTKTHIQRFELIRPGQFYFDACYNPSKTAFLKNAEKKGCKILNGLGMSSSRGLLRSNYGPDRRLHWMWCEKN